MCRFKMFQKGHYADVNNKMAYETGYRADVTSSLVAMAPVLIAPSIQRALRQITAKETTPPVHGISGKFWDPESDSECEDLGAAEPLVCCVAITPTIQQLRQPLRSIMRGSRTRGSVNHRYQLRHRHPQRQSGRRGRGYGGVLFRRDESRRRQS
jgi:hypothetical protein